MGDLGGGLRRRPQEAPGAVPTMVDHELESHNAFSVEYYASILGLARDAGYRFLTLREFLHDATGDEQVVLLRHDLDARPRTLVPMLEAERELGVRSTVFVRVAGSEYNPFGWETYPILRAASDGGCEIGLHTNFVEFATLNGLEPREVLAAEWRSLSQFFALHGVAPHRDINYAYNSLPLLEQEDGLLAGLGCEYHAYDPRFFEHAVYVNEGLDPHLCWRGPAPEQVVAEGRSMYLLTHPHWWWSKHPFEAHR